MFLFLSHVVVRLDLFVFLIPILIINLCYKIGIACCSGWREEEGGFSLNLDLQGLVGCFGLGSSMIVIIVAPRSREAKRSSPFLQFSFIFLYMQLIVF